MRGPGVVSVRPDQRADPARARYPQVVDAHEGIGPIAGIAAAQALHPDAAWLVLACDLPFLDGRTLQYLLEHRAPERVATAFRSSHDGLPEPLCAIFEPGSAAAIRATSAGKSCPRKFLIRSDPLLLEQPEPRALDNINTPEEYGAARGAVPGTQGHAAMQIKVQYSPSCASRPAASEETVTTTARTPRDLYEQLRHRHPFSLGADSLRVAVNADFSDWSRPLADGDAVVFIPPVAGG